MAQITKNSLAGQTDVHFMEMALEEARQAAEQQHGINEGNDAIAVHFGSSLLLVEWDWFLQGESAGRRPGGGAAAANEVR